MRQLELSFDLILTSPFVRARRNAEIVADVFESNQLRESKTVAVGSDARSLILELNAAFNGAKDILLVGHEPYLSKLISLLCGDAEGFSIHFKKSSLCKLTVTELRFGRCATLEWLLTSRQLKQLATSGSQSSG